MRKISKKLAIFLLTYNLIDPAMGLIVCKGFANDDNEFVEVLNEDIEALEQDDNYKEFQIWIAERQHNTNN